MKTTAMMWATKAVGAGAVALLLATPAFAQSRGDWSRNNQSNRGAQANQTRAGHDNNYSNHNDNNYRESQRTTESARITSFAHERNGYRVGFDRGRSYWVPESRGHGLRVGLSVNLGYLLGGYAYDNGYVRGVIDRVDYRTGTVWLQDDRSGAEIRAAIGGYALRGLHRGELVELTGQWIGGGVFDVARVASIRY